MALPSIVFHQNNQMESSQQFDQDLIFQNFIMQNLHSLFETFHIPFKIFVRIFLIDVSSIQLRD